ncbi:hypothetical protein QWJ07_32885 [Frankia sp. RB7]|nr:hypothetical protein [Frankia sp. RB7]
MQLQQRRPLVPEDRRQSHRPATFLYRALLSHALDAAGRDYVSGEAFSEDASAERIARKRWRDDIVEPTELILRGAVPPAETDNPDWAGVLARDSVADFVESLEALGAGGKVLNAARRVLLGRHARLLIPRRDGPTAPTGHWCGEDGLIPVARYSLQAAKLGPMKRLAVIVVMTRELVESSAAEVVLTTLAREGEALALDMKLFSDDPETALAPPGLMVGIPPIAAASGGDNAAALDDLSALAGSIAPFTSGPVVFVAHPLQAAFINLRRGFAVASDVQVLPTLGVQPGTVIALDPAALASAFEPQPEIKSSKDAVLHMEADDPQPISIEGSPANIVAAPSQSMFQTDCISTRLTLRCAWAWRAAGCAAWIKNASWGSAAATRQVRRIEQRDDGDAHHDVRHSGGPSVGHVADNPDDDDEHHHA